MAVVVAWLGQLAVVAGIVVAVAGTVVVVVVLAVAEIVAVVVLVVVAAAAVVFVVVLAVLVVAPVAPVVVAAVLSEVAEESNDLLAQLESFEGKLVKFWQPMLDLGSEVRVDKRHFGKL